MEYGLFLVVSAVARALPERAGLALGAALGWVAGSVVRVRRPVVLENLGRAFPERDERWWAGVCRGAYRHLGREAVSLLRLQALSAEEVRECTEVVGLEYVRAPLAVGRGVLILTGHLGNWEVGGAATAAQGIPLDVVVRRQKNPLFHARLVRVRERLGMRVIDRRGATRAVLRSLREPRAVALVADQNARAGGLFVDFFGVPASTERGPSLLVDRTGAAAVFAFVHRLPGPRARYRLTFEPLDGDPAGTEPDHPTALTRRYLSALEREIRAAPDQYFWFHRRWKTRPGKAEEPESSPAVPDPPAPGRDEPPGPVMDYGGAP